MAKIRIAIDGYSGCGKSSTAKAVANHLGYKYLDSGAMYRGITYLLIKNDIAFDDLDLIKQLLSDTNLDFIIGEDGSCRLHSNGEDLEPHLRTMTVNKSVSKVSTIEIVREKLVEEQRRYGEEGGIVMDGRDIGTVVFPTAELKLFLTADLEIRAQRRQLQLKSKGIEASLEEIIENFKKRDEIDSGRDISPLRKAQDAIEIDTSNLQFQDQVNQIIRLSEEAAYDH